MKHHRLKFFEYKHPIRVRGFLGAIWEVPNTNKKIKSLRFIVLGSHGELIVKVAGKKAEAVLTWHQGSYVEVEGWKCQEHSKEMSAMHGKVVSSIIQTVKGESA